jgi:hypothetical protein
MGSVRIKLIRKLADKIDGVDVSRYSVGDTLQVPADQARLLVAEQWAIADSDDGHRGTERPVYGA